ncbi:MAG: hypothetical protein AAF658_17300, partial [Myxococcota bacterium]
MVFLTHHELWLARAWAQVDAPVPPVRRSMRLHGEEAILWIVGALFVATVVLAASSASAAPIQPRALQKTATQAIQRKISPPRVPKGFPSCESGMELNRDLPRTLGETIRYVVDVDGVSLGQIDFRVERAGRVDGRPVTEYRSRFALDALIASVVPVSGQAAAIVPTDDK